MILISKKINLRISAKCGHFVQAFMHYQPPWASYQIHVRKVAGYACAGNAGNVFRARVSDPDMHHGTCVTHVPWCMPESLTSGFLWSRWRGKRSRLFRIMRNPQLCVSGKRSVDIKWAVWFRVCVITVQGNNTDHAALYLENMRFIFIRLDALLLSLTCCLCYE